VVYRAFRPVREGITLWLQSSPGAIEFIDDGLLGPAASGTVPHRAIRILAVRRLGG
jgi:hypothetical protein